MSKHKTKKNKARVNFDVHSDNESVNDMASTYSNGSLEEENIGTQDEPQLVIEKYEEKLLQSIENATEKSTQIRIQALHQICDIFQHRYIPDFIEDRKCTLMDIVEKSLRRGKGAEQEWAARLSTLLIVQLGGDEDVSDNIKQILLQSLNNKTISNAVRGLACTALSMIHFLGTEDIEEIVETMRQCEQIFSASYSKIDKSAPTVNDDVAQLHVSALGAWGLLATVIPPGDFCSYINKNSILRSMNNLIGLLQSSHVDIRMACGVIIAVVFECGRSFDEVFMEDYVQDLINTTSLLSKDSQKFRAKRERKAQRASFRDVLRYLEDDVSPEIQIRFGKETLSLRTWTKNIQYEKLCDVIGPGITTHLSENEFLRDVFQLGPPLQKDDNIGVHKQTKLERHLVNSAAFKARTLSLKKNRDKRSVL